ncbi:MAG: NADH-quinone oxidoreductase subunit M [Candidatus Micrarchaeota archaeon]|nr:NADH-quinone oxidoreductase subunit M [Candidatus Micrarchaeota archaeon]
MLPLLLLIVLIPFAFILPILLLDKRHSYKIAFVASALSFLLVGVVAYSYYTGTAVASSPTQFYIQQLNLSFSLQTTPYTVLLLIMTSIVFLAASIVGKYFIGARERTYNIIFLLAQGASLGVFLASSLVFFYIFWEITEIMMFFIIFMYGGYNRRYASIKFIIYSIISSLLLLIGIMLLYSAPTIHTFDIASIIKLSSTLSMSTQLLVMMLFLVAFMIKMPVFPFHTWLPDAHTEAPTTGSMILAGVLLKFGGYGLMLMFLMLPIASSYTLYFFLLFLFSTIYSAFVSLRQSNLKRLIAYTSITDMGIVAIGLSAINAAGYNGGLYMMFNHGIAISLLFLIAGTIDELYGTLEINKIKGVINNFPGITYLFILGTFIALGIPLSSGFIADLILFIGATSAFGLMGLLALAGILIIGAALFWVIERSFMSVSHASEPYNVFDRSVTIAGILLIAAAVLFGIMPLLLYTP